jgi:hypothetical protein
MSKKLGIQNEDPSNRHLEDPLAALHGLRGGLQRLLLALARQHLHVEHDEYADHGANKPAEQIVTLKTCIQHVFGITLLSPKM